MSDRAKISLPDLFVFNTRFSENDLIKPGELNNQLIVQIVILKMTELSKQKGRRWGF